MSLSALAASVQMNRGGKRKGAGRPFGSTSPEPLKRKPFNARLPLWLIKWLRSQPRSQGRVIEEALIAIHGLSAPKED